MDLDHYLPYLPIPVQLLNKAQPLEWRVRRLSDGSQALEQRLLSSPDGPPVWIWRASLADSSALWALVRAHASKEFVEWKAEEIAGRRIGEGRDGIMEWGSGIRIDDIVEWGSGIRIRRPHQ